MKLNQVVAGVLLATGVTGAYAGEFKAAAQPEKAVKGQYIVVLKDDAVTANMGLFSSNASEQAIAMVSDNLSRKYQAQVQRTFTKAVKGGVFNMSEKAAQKLAQDPNVLLVEEDQIVSINATQNNATWGLDRIDQRNLPLSGSYTYNTTASNVNAYIIDTGILGSHSEFSGRFMGGYDFVDNDSNPNDCNGHGTHVAGTVGGSTYGVAKGVKLYGLKVLGCNGSGTNSGVIAGIDWVANNHVKPAVANMSLGGGASSATDNAVANLVASGVTVAVAAGNDNSNACNYSPAREPSAITVGSTTSSDSRSSFSNYGSCLDIYAPGSSITSAWSNGGTNTISGTSMASPHVAGVAALYLANNPNATPAQVEAAIENAATSGKVTDAKSGSPNLLLYSLFDGSTPPPPPPPGGNELENGVSVTFSGAQGSETDFTFDVPSSASNVSFDMSGGTGDADIYVKFGSAPTTSSYDCRPYRNGNTESCDFTAQTGTYYVMVRGYTSYSNVNLVATHDGGGTNPPPAGGSATLENLSGASGSFTHYYVDIPAGMSSLNVQMSGGSGDADLYVRRGSQPTTSSYDCRPYRYGNNETCSFSNPAQDRWYISIRGYSSYSGVTLQVDWQ
ncbi:alkaline serine protease [Kangiella profundi]|uniref:Alkaline serine protease n=1 Tax=Kangiella profundi TaxID=1561924 RepID=A0A2K9ADZ4_9GAMM|nr:S8 family serine peptidase [Kangiella profundi]AUD79657.1 alkaline serine protease [Kangiella profundi]GGE96595.1 alkaline serine protease [Kangiella profundi]